MPIYHYTLHAYASWHPDHPDGWYQHNFPDKLRPDPKIAQYRRKRQRFPTIAFTPAIQSHLLLHIVDICSHRNWRCHATATTPTHLHTIISWHDQSPPRPIQSTLKRLLGLHLAQLHNTPGRQWFSERGNPSHINDAAHLRHLLTIYLPNQGGLFWQEGNPLPTL